jgi:uncharacterized protein with ParB-like and HNH nuclease domain
MQDDYLCDQDILEAEVKIDNTESNDITPRVFNLTSKIQKESINLAFKSFMEEIGNLEYKIPIYQRSYVWKKDQIEALVFSLLMDYPIPPIYVYVDPKSKERYILDGQQRVISLYLYFSGCTLITNDLIDFNEILPTAQEFKLDLDKLSDEAFETDNGKHFLNYIQKSRYKKKLKETNFTINVEHSEIKKFDLTYKNLLREVKIELNKKTLNIVTVKTVEESGESDTSRMEYCEIFNLLNNGGTPLKPQEIRNAIYSSDFYDMLHQVNNTPKWKEIVGKEHKHSKHVEFLLRFCSTYHFTELSSAGMFKFKVDGDDNSVYQGYPKFLNLASEEFKKFDKEQVKIFKEKLLKFISKFSISDDCLKFTPLMLEGLFLVSQYKNIDHIDEELQKKILKNEKYKVNIKSSSSSRNKVEERITIIYGEC